MTCKGAVQSGQKTDLRLEKDREFGQLIVSDSGVANSKTNWPVHCKVKVKG